MDNKNQIDAIKQYKRSIIHLITCGAIWILLFVTWQLSFWVYDSIPVSCVAIFLWTLTSPILGICFARFLECRAKRFQ